MAALATTHVVLQVRGTVLQLQIIRRMIQDPAVDVGGDAILAYERVFAFQGLLLFANNLVTDGFFIYRCFIIWGRSTRVTVIPIFMLLGSAIMGCLTAAENAYGGVQTNFIDPRIPFGVTLATNALLMGLTVGRIWWIRRDACIVLDSAHVRKYDTVIAIILESGAIYCLALLLYLIAFSVTTKLSVESTNTVGFGTALLVSTSFQVSLSQIMNIAPMLTIVRVALGRVVDGDSTTGPRQQG
ncbi:hypothetical protein DFH06DRAFT_1203506 [Mycena polygramma]|nr:hypothetical protein DFH06DRAFT_1203506 [Mycena polygramma]